MRISYLTPAFLSASRNPGNRRVYEFVFAGEVEEQWRPDVSHIDRWRRMTRQKYRYIAALGLTNNQA
jgi:hypothetical protein